MWNVWLLRGGEGLRKQCGEVGPTEQERISTFNPQNRPFANFLMLIPSIFRANVRDDRDCICYLTATSSQLIALILNIS